MARLTLFGIPAQLKRSISRLFSGALLDILWKLLLVVGGGTLLYLMVVSSTFILAFIAGILLSAFLADDIAQAGRDIWNRNWADVKINPGL